MESVEKSSSSSEAHEHIVLQGYLLKKKSKRLQGFARRYFTLTNTGIISYSVDSNLPPRQRVSLHHCSTTVPHPPPLSQHPQPPGHVPRASRSFHIDTGREVWHLRALNEGDFELWTNTLARIIRHEGSMNRGKTVKLTDQDVVKSVNDLGRNLNLLEEHIMKLKGDTDDLPLNSNAPNSPTMVSQVGGGKFAKIFKKGLFEHSFLQIVDGSGLSGAKPIPSPHQQVPHRQEGYFPGLTLEPSIVPESGHMSMPVAHSPPMMISSGSFESGPVGLTSHLQSMTTILEAMKSAHRTLLNVLLSCDDHNLSEVQSAEMKHPLGVKDPRSESDLSLANLQNSTSFFPSLLPGLATSLNVLLNPVYGGNSAPFRHAPNGSRSSVLGRRTSVDSSVTVGAYEDALEGEFLELDEVDADDLVDDVIVEEDHAVTTFDSNVVSPSVLSQLKEPAGRRRAQLPAPVSGEELSLATLVRKSIGKDLTKIALPISMNEPLSALQKLAEDYEYVNLLDKAARAQTGEERAMWIAAFGVSCYGGTALRGSRKPFNPMMGETYELLDDARQMKFIAEKVSHHPPIMAAHVEGQGWNVELTSGVNQKFWGRSIEFIHCGQNKVCFEDGEKWSWMKPSTFVENIMQPEKKINHRGKLHVTRVLPTAGPTATITFDAGSRDIWGNLKNASDTDMLVKGEVRDAKGNIARDLLGRWNEVLMWMKGPEDIMILWKCEPFPDAARQYYGFSNWAVGLNEITPNIEPFLPPTDSRKRPDQRLFENGHVEEAEQVKLKLEDKQRKRRALNGADPPPFFFTEKGGEWMYKGGYWERRQGKNWGELPDIF